MAIPNQIFNYDFKLYGIYLIANEREFISTLNKKKYRLDEWLILTPCTNKTNHYLNSLD